MDVINVEYYYTAVFCSDLDLVKKLVNGIVSELTSVIGSYEMVLETRVILNELLINGVLHGNHYCRNKAIRLSIILEDNSLDISVEDEGEGFLYSKNANNGGKLQCNGRGLTIVERLSDRFIVENNRIKVQKSIN